jgi:conjugative transfer signal peptidase TraF
MARRRLQPVPATAAAVLGVVAIAAGTFAHPLPRLVWNASASAPLGLYRVERERVPKRGDLVLARLPAAAHALAAARDYLPSGVPVVKRIAALGGDLVCANSGIVVIENRVVADQLAIDGAGRPLPAWNACRVLAADEAFLLMQGVPDSFDSRYFGPVRTRAIIGRLVPLWTW